MNADSLRIKQSIGILLALVILFSFVPLAATASESSADRPVAISPASNTIEFTAGGIMDLNNVFNLSSPGDTLIANLHNFPVHTTINIPSGRTLIIRPHNMLAMQGFHSTLTVTGDHRHFHVSDGATLIMELSVAVGNPIFGASGHTHPILQGQGTHSGGVHVADGGTFIMNAGEIRGNTADIGAGVLVDGGVFDMNGGVISDNSATNSGGGVAVTGNAAVTMGGGEIRDNTAGTGGGVAITNINASFTLIGGTINNNTSTNNGGGVAMQGGTLTVKDGEISGNFTEGNGGGIYLGVVSAPLTINGGSIVNNSTDGDGGGIFAAAHPENYRVPLQPTDYPNITITSNVIFSGNTARLAVMPHSSAANITRLQSASTSIYDHLLNNYDINFIHTPTVEHLVTFNLQGGGPSADFPPQTVTHDETATHPATEPTRTGFTFAGWFTAQTGGVIFDFSTPITEDTTIHAQWTENITLPPPVPSSRQAYLIGTDTGLIRPDVNITRADVAAIFFRLIDDDMRAANWTKTNPYLDVALENWFNNAVSTTTRLGIFRGRSDGTFAPNDPITRAELATAVTRFMDVAGMANIGNDFFNDIHGHWANAHINTAATHNWVQGPDGHGGAFYPDRPITRAETAAIINRIFQRLPETPADLLPDMITWPDNTNIGAWYYLYIQAASNSYTYEMRPDGIHERWLSLIPARDWAALERPNSTPGDIGA